MIMGIKITAAIQELSSEYDDTAFFLVETVLGGVAVG